MSHNTSTIALQLDSLLIRSPRWAENGAGHLAQADTSLQRHSRARPVRHGVTLERDGRNHSRQPVPDQPTPRLTVGHVEVFGWMA